MSPGVAATAAPQGGSIAAPLGVLCSDWAVIESADEFKQWHDDT